MGKQWGWMALGLLQLAGRPLIAAPLGTITVAADATEVTRGIVHTRLTLPVTPGPLTLVYPKWLPGNHSPTGPIRNLVSLTFQAGGKTLTWERDLVDMYAFHLTVPAGVDQLTVNFDFLAEKSGTANSDKVAVVQWNALVLYPEGIPTDQLTYQANLSLPSGWKYGTALPVAQETPTTITFQPVSLTTLVDSPLNAGMFARKIPLTNNGPTHEIDIVADSAEALEMKPELVAHYQNLVREAEALFGSRHYRDYHFLWTLSDAIDGRGLEHHQSSDNVTSERTLLDEGMRKASADLLPHEFVHSWNGKYRRPADLATPDFQQPMKDDLLWVYEGLTQYLGWVLTGRSGLLSPKENLEALALTAATQDNTPGRNWRTLSDTAVAAQLRRGAGGWTSLRRGSDYYPESLLIWLEADTIIRQNTRGKRSLDDFCRAFHGGPGGEPSLKTYTFNDVVTTLNAIAPYNWAEFFTTRINTLAPRAPLGGITGGGWQLVYEPERPDYFKVVEQVRKSVNLSFSIGLTVDSKDGTLLDVVPGLAAANAGLAPDMKLVAVNGRTWTPDLLRQAVAQTKTQGAILELLVTNRDYYHSYRLDYQGGEKYPQLVRQPSTPDLVSAILQPLTR